MPFPPILLLLGAGLAVVAVAGGKKKRRVRGFKFASQGALDMGLGLRLRGVPHALLPDKERAHVIKLFGEGTLDEYPAPYRYQDVWQLTHIALDAASETAPAFVIHRANLVGRLHAIDAADMAPWRKSFALIMTVLIPSFASPVWWHWYRDAGAFTPIKQDRFNAIIAYCGMFLAMPHTSTAATTIEINKPQSSLLRGMPKYLDAHTPLRRGNLNPREIRRVLYDVFSYMKTWPAQNGSTSTKAAERAQQASAHMNNLAAVYPIGEPELAHVIEGNMKAVDEIVWLANANVQSQIHVEFDEAAAIARLVLEVVKIVVAVVDIVVGGAIGDAINKAASALTQLAVMIANGEVSTAQVQAMAGAGITVMLDQTGIRLDLDDEIAALNKASAGL